MKKEGVIHVISYNKDEFAFFFHIIGGIFMNIIVVGAIAGGATVASQIRRLLPDASITLIGNDERIAYGTCGMPFVIGNAIEQSRLVGGPSPTSFSEKKNIQTYTKHEVTQINRQDKVISARNLQTDDTTSFTYDRLILATGTSSRIPQYEGLETIPFFTLKTFNEMEKIDQFITDQQPTSCAVIGGGFIGIELAEAFRHRQLNTTVILRGDRVMSGMDPEISTLLMEEMAQNGVQFIKNDEIESIDGTQLTFKSGEQLQVDFLTASIGTIPNTSLAKEAQLAIGDTKGIVVNDFMQTTDPDIYAIGDVAETKNAISGKPARIELSWHAHRQAFIVAQHIANRPIAIQPVLGTTITKLFSLTASMTGLSEKIIQQQGLSYETVTYKGRTNAGYYPDVGQITIRLHYDPTTRHILGAQAVGTKGVDKRIDVLATAISGQLSVDALASLELGYSPPYSSPKDPINMLGYQAIEKSMTS